ncbi:ribose ABC transporter ATP-binding protein [Spiroplasma clarkii]|uniref:Ribose ABC transporter ATP-binding protein n=2 Tax=Spiroplasma clarkii TaxID=2139 RepID=A0A2K8KJV5_9MOLU|nr:ribose ABC transporter ATP-binding protein [Spiroplasma clarkii]
MKKADMNLNKILSLNNVIKKFGDVVALKGVSLNSYKGICMAVLGENGAGKSTLMNIISGVYKKTSGEMFFEKKEWDPKNTKHAEKLGVAIIHQELNTVNEMTVLDNVFLGSEIKTKLGTINYKKELKILNEVLIEIEINIDPMKEMNRLSVAEQQMIEIAKAIIRDAKVIIMDEPTSSLSNKETLKLFEVIKKMKAQNKSIIYISHRLQEIPVVCERMTIIRDGTFIGEYLVGELSEDEIIAKMVGRSITEKFPQKIKKAGEKIFEVKHLRNDFLKNVSFEIKSNEILGFAGLVGAKRTELFKTIIGLYPKINMEMNYLGKEVNFKSPNHAIRQNFYYVTEDRKLEGLHLNESIKFNISLSSIDKLKVKFLRFISGMKEIKNSEFYFQKTLIKAPDIDRVAGNLSGGNQQKVLIAKALSANPKIIVFDEPTRGVDVGARREIYDLIYEFKKNNNGGIVVISNDLPEIIGLCDRVLVMKNGIITKEILEAEMNQETILRYAI